MTQTALNGTCDDATVAQLMAFTEAEPTHGIYIYTDTAVNPSGNGVAASTLLQYNRVKTSGPAQIFNNTNLLPANMVTTLPKGTVLFLNKRANKATNTQLL